MMNFCDWSLVLSYAFTLSLKLPPACRCGCGCEAMKEEGRVTLCQSINVFLAKKKEKEKQDR